MVHCSAYEHCNRGSVAILAIQGSGNKTTSGKTKVFGRVLSSVQLPATCPSQRRKRRIKAPRCICTLSSPTWYFHRGGQERFVEAVIRGSAHNNYTHRILLSCRQQLIFLWQWICNLPSQLLTLHLLGVNSSKQFISRAWVVVLTSITVCLGVSPLCLCVCTFNLLWRP